jgi:hypothetical protein
MMMSPYTTPLHFPCSSEMAGSPLASIARDGTRPLTRLLCRSTATASSGPESIVLDSMALVDQTPSIYSPQQRAEYAPQTRAVPLLCHGE